MMLSRRHFGAGLCACGALAVAGCQTTDALSRPAVAGQPLAAEMPVGYRPALSSDEGGLWAQADKAEARLRSSHFVVRDPKLTAYVTGLCNRLAGEHARDMRVYVVRTPAFNASMAPNGTMVIWTGLLLRAENEAQLAAVIGHEMGHYMRRHLVYQMRDAVNKSTFMTFASMGMAVAGVGAFSDVVSLAVLASHYAYSRDHEREADRWGLDVMLANHLDPYQAATIWENLIAEDRAYKEQQSRNVVFATHPEPDERSRALRAQADAALHGNRSGYTTNEAAYRAALSDAWLWLLRDELRLRTYPSSLVLFERLIRTRPDDADAWFAKGELHRTRDAEGDDRAAQAALAKSVSLAGVPPIAWRSLGFLHQRKGRFAEAVPAFEAYLKAAAADADDRAIIQTYIANGGRA
jgi:predicted Zn-dependent protease